MRALLGLSLALLLAAPAPARKVMLTARRVYSNDRTLSIPMLPGWEIHPHELEHMHNNPKDLWVSKKGRKAHLRFRHTRKSWRRLRAFYEEEDADPHETKTGIRAYIDYGRPVARGALECFGSRYEFESRNLSYAELRRVIDSVACRTAEPDKKKPKPRKDRSFEPTL